MTISRIIFLGALFILVVLNTGCAPNNDELFESSNALLTIDRQWTDITTYQEVYSGLLPSPDIYEDSPTFSNYEKVAVKKFTIQNRGRLRDLRSKLEVINVGVSGELLTVKTALARIYDEELALFSPEGWRPFQNYQNAEDYIAEFGDTPVRGRNVYQQWIADSFLSPWVDVQLDRKFVYEHWLNILEEHQASAELIEEFNRTISKQ
jgi:hypothetical protein